MSHLKRWWTKSRLAVRHAWQNGSFWLALAFLAMLPVWFNPEIAAKSVIQDTLFVIDVSESMNVQDVDYPRPHTSRLTLAKSAVKESMASMPCGSRVSLALFAGEEAVVLFEPLEVCRHYPSIEAIIGRINTNMRWIGDSWLIRGVTSAIKQAEERKLNMVFVTDGDEMPHRKAPRITDLIDYQGKIKGALWGVGHQAPQPVPRMNSQGEILGYWTPEEAVIEGNYPNLLAYVKNLAEGESGDADTMAEVSEHLSGFNPSFLKTVAQTLLIPYSKIEHPNDATKAMQDTTLQKQAIAQRDARWIFGLVAFCLVLIGWFWQQIKQLFGKSAT